MNKIEYLLTCVSEECSEVAKECSKALRFGLEDQLTLDPAGPRGTEGPTNRDKLVDELNDLLGVVMMLEQEGVIPANWMDQEKWHQKQAKVIRFMEYSARVGCLQEADTSAD